MANITVVTGANAVVRVNGNQVALMRNVSVTETFTRERVVGLGHILPSEYPITAWEGRLQAGLFLVTVRDSPFVTNVRRDVQNRTQFEDYMIIGEDDIQIDIFKKVSEQRDANGLPVIVPEILLSVRGARMDNESFSINDGQVADKGRKFHLHRTLIVP